MVVIPESAPPPETVQVTPALFWSLVTVAVSVTVSVASTMMALAVMATLGVELPPHPAMAKETNSAKANRANLF